MKRIPIEGEGSDGRGKGRKEVERKLKGEQRRLKPGKKAMMKELTARLEKSGSEL